MPSPFRRGVTGRVSVVAHRGASAEAPENTMAAFRRALAVGCDLLEFDCHLSRDGAVVVIHDDTLERTTNGRGLVRDHTFAELRRLDAGSWFSPRFAAEPVPSLDEVLAWARARPLVLSIEIKRPRSGGYEGIEGRVADLVRRSGMDRRVVIHSFDADTVARAGAALPTAVTAVTFGRRRRVEPVAAARGAGALGVHLWWEDAVPERVAAAHDAGFHVHAWGMPEPLDAETVARLESAGVDGIVANDPRRLRELLEPTA